MAGNSLSLKEKELELLLLEQEEEAATPAPASVNIEQERAVASQPAAPSPQAEKYSKDPSLLQRVHHVSQSIPEAAFGIAEIPGLLGNAAAWGAEKLGYDPRGIALAKATLLPRAVDDVPVLRDVKKYMTTGSGVDPEANPLTDALRTTGNWSAGGALAKFNKVSALPDVLMGAGAGIGDYLDGDKGWGEMAGGMLGLVQALRGKAPVGLDSTTEKATQFIDDALTDTPNALANVEKGLAAGDIETLGGLSDSSNLFNFEHTLGERGKPLHDMLKAKVDAGNAQTVGRVGEMLPDAPLSAVKSAAQQQTADTIAAAQKDAQGRVNVAQTAFDAETAAEEAAQLARIQGIADIDAMIAALRGESEGVGAKYAGAPTQAQASVELHTAKDMHGSVSDRYAKEEWAKFDDSPPVDASHAVSAVDDAVKSAIPDAKGADRLAFDSAYGREMDIIDSWREGLASPTSIQAVLRDMRQKISNSRQQGRGTYVDNVAYEVVEKLDAALRTGATTKNYANAIAATKKYYDEVLPEHIKKAMVSPTKETFAKRIGFSGEQGAATGRNIKASKDDATIDAAMDYMRSTARVEGLSDAFLTKYEGFLSEFPALKDEFTQGVKTLNEAAAGVTAAEAKKGVLAKAIAASDKNSAEAERLLAKSVAAIKKQGDDAAAQAAKTPIGKFANDAEGRVHTLLNKGGDPSSKELGDLLSWADKNGVGDSFRSQVKVQMMNKLFTETGGLKKATGKSVNQWDLMQDTLVNSKVFTRDEANVIRERLVKTFQTAEKRGDAGVVPVVPKLTSREKAASMLGAMGVVGSTGVPHALIATRWTKEMIQNEITRRKLPQEAVDKVGDFMVNPEKYVAAYKLLKESKGKIDAARSQKIISAIVATGAANKEEDQ